MEARVIAEHRGQWTVNAADGERPAVLSGALREAITRGESDRPAVGDHVTLRLPTGDADALMIETVLPRRTKIARRAAGKQTREQVVAANVDVVFIVCALGRDVNAHRIERFVSLTRTGGALPVIILNKADTMDDPTPYVERARAAAPGVELHLVSARAGTGLAPVTARLLPGTTAALLGTSGAGKSTLVNHWLGADTVATAGVGAAGKGRHTTTGRQLLMLPSGAAVIDTPGLREVGLWSGEEGVDETFVELSAIAEGCRFRDCGHAGEPGCAVLVATQEGRLDATRVESWRRLQAEQAHITRQTTGPAGRQRPGERTMTRALRARLKDKRR